MENKNFEKGSARWVAPVFMVLCFLFLVYDLVLVFGGPTVTIIGPANWTMGLINASRNVYSPNNGSTWTINGSSDGLEDINATVNSTGNWTPGATSQNNTFVLKAANMTQAITLTPTTIYTNLPKGSNFTTGFNFTAPSGGEQGPHTMTVKLTAWRWRSPDLTYPNPPIQHTEADCTAIGGTVYTIAMGFGDDSNADRTLCRITGSTVPAGWTYASGWINPHYHDDCDQFPPYSTTDGGTGWRRYQSYYWRYYGSTYYGDTTSCAISPAFWHRFASPNPYACYNVATYGPYSVVSTPTPQTGITIEVGVY